MTIMIIIRIILAYFHCLLQLCLFLVSNPSFLFLKVFSGVDQHLSKRLRMEKSIFLTTRALYLPK